MISRNQIETEFMKKKIHFVSDFRLYNEMEGSQNMQLALQVATLSGNTAT